MAVTMPVEQAEVAVALTLPSMERMERMEEEVAVVVVEL